MMNPPTVSYGPSSGTLTPARSSSSSGRSMPGKVTQSRERTTPDPGAIVLVRDLADELLDEVLQRRDSGGAAVFVDHDRHLVAASPQLAEQHVEFHGLRHAQRVRLQRRHRHVGAFLPRHGDRLLHVHQPDDVVDAVVDRPGTGRIRFASARSMTVCAGSVRSTLATLSRGVITSSAVCRLNTRVRESSVAVSRSRLPARAERRTSDRSSSAVRAEDSSSFGSMPKARRMALAVLLSSRTAGLNTAVKRDLERDARAWPSRSGSASAKFFGTSSPMIMEISVAITTADDGGDARPTATGGDPGSGQYRPQQAAERRFHRETGEQRGEGDAQLRAGEVGRGDLERTDGPGQAALAAFLPGLEIRTVEVDQGELGGDEEAGADREEESDAQQK